MGQLLQSLRPEMIGRYGKIVSLLWRYADSELLERAGLEEALSPNGRPEPLPEDAERPESLASELEEMGPTFIKLGQLLSTRADLLPAAYRDALARLQDDIDPRPFSEIEQIIGEELGVRPSKGFASVESVPLATASLAQVHRATLRDGREVVIKVQRPNIRRDVELDLEALETIAAALDRHSETARRYSVRQIVEEFRHTLMQELDFEVEAQNLRHLRRSLAEFPNLVVPAPIDGYVSSRVLVMEYVPGVKLTEINGVVKTELDGAGLAEELFRGYLHQVLVDGTFHADPHPGNVLLTPEHRIALIDVGMVGHFHPSDQRDLIALLLALADGRGEDTAQMALKLAERRDDADLPGFMREIEGLVAQAHDAKLEDVQLGHVLMEVCQIAAVHGVLLPPNMSLLGKALLNLDEIGRCLEPRFDPQAAVREYSTELLAKHVGQDSSGSLAGGLLEAKEFAQQLPGRANQILELVADNKLKVTVDAIDEERLIEGIEKVANRITAGLVLAALIVGAALLMRVPTQFTLFGYPGIAMVFFLAAALGGFILVYRVLKTDDRSRA